MRAILCYLTGLALLGTSLAEPAFASKCYGEDPCSACRTCSSCKHCAVYGGTCGICKPARGTGASKGKHIPERLSNHKKAR